MEALLQVPTSVLKNLIVISIKTFMQALLSYPINVAVMVGVFVIVAVRMWTQAHWGRDVRKVREEVDVGKVKEGLGGLRREVVAIGEDVREMGIKFGLHANTSPTTKQQETTNQPILPQFHQQTNKSLTSRNQFQKIRNTSNQILHELQALSTAGLGSKASMKP